MTQPTGLPEDWGMKGPVPCKRRERIEEIFAAVEAVTGVDRGNIRSKRMMPHIYRARFLAAILLADKAHMTQRDIGSALNRDHSTIGRELARAEKLLSTPDFNAQHAAALARLRQKEAA